MKHGLILVTRDDQGNVFEVSVEDRLQQILDRAPNVDWDMVETFYRDEITSLLKDVRTHNERLND